MNYLYKITVEVDDDKIIRFEQHDINAVYNTIRSIFADCEFTEQEPEGETLVFTIGNFKDSFSDACLAIDVLNDCWLGKYLKKIMWYDTSDESVEDVFEELKEFEAKYGG